ncbi:MAG: hypothetical protein A2Y00_01515 [Omnitrophica WOR_2 bacterium GWF2_43_52]|nr:MAG: hypothetical protein A2Y01_05045 [Omnitrophica WOR_2 bacterium GWC2_44_8]OGX20036.1 MAG: hypothetical protein A2Y00_01515 [Omnitrophica WOR_2 bacterium GWF2_43_52]OGX58008.1 MAG: hypothetical protein A2460_02380 [Omnitrophica WOR_2 bacterium RIFOXYC2_FULL_43_9]HAH19642.1 hypothetical protein [Candidatus Omnitrophota bacterium]HBG64105.1 hypothetical protein [Candidatus Omnitrophota bacterium]
MRQFFLIVSWGLYDLANQFFALNIVSLYFVRWLTIEKQVPEIFYSIAFSISTLVVAIITPVLGSVSDILNKRMPFLIFFTLLSVIFTMMLGTTGNIVIELVFFAIANCGCQAAVVFYNALLVDVAPKEKIGLVSGFGRMLAYSGALVALYLVKPIVLKSGYQATFFPTGMWFLIFALPSMLFLKDKAKKENRGLFSLLKKDRAAGIVKDLKTGLRATYKLPGFSDFLKASFYGLCVANVIIIFMSAYATNVFKLNETQIINVVGFSTFFAIAGSLISGYICDRVGSVRMLMAIFFLWEVFILLGALVKKPSMYLGIGALAGISLGATWTVARALAVELTPEEKMGNVFGLFNLAGYLSAVMGALFWGAMLFCFSRFGVLSYRISLFSLSIFLVLGFVYLLRLVKALPVKA